MGALTSPSAAAQLAEHVRVKPRSVLLPGRGCSASPEQKRAKRFPASLLRLSTRHSNAAQAHTGDIIYHMYSLSTPQLGGPWNRRLDDQQSSGHGACAG